MLVSGSLPPMRCGVGEYTLRLAHELATTPGVKVAVLTSRDAAADSGGGIQVLPVMEKWGLTDAGTAQRAMKEWSPDVVHIQYPTLGYRAGRLPMFLPMMASFLGVRVVRTWHEIPVGRELLGFTIEALAPGPYVVVRPEFQRGLHPLLAPLIAARAGGLVSGGSLIPRSLNSDEHRQALRARLAKGKDRLIVFFGFLLPPKGVELLFEIANPATDQIVIAGEASVDPHYREDIEGLANEMPWRTSVTMTGFLSGRESADLLAAADAVVLPFHTGAGVWNSSIHAAVLQGTAVITTSQDASGLDEKRNIYFSAPGDVAAMRSALNRLAGRRRAFDPEIDRDEWPRIAAQHLAIYTATSEPCRKRINR
jgi:glycosyltransferase involved in cell wall biosynthesis